VRQITIAISFACATGLFPTALALAPRAANPVAIVAAPWASGADAARIVAAADGSLLATASGGRIAIARFTAEDFVSRLYSSGALAVIDAAAVTACFSIDRNQPASTRASL
jgi:hypothetical protein